MKKVMGVWKHAIVPIFGEVSTPSWSDISTLGWSMDWESRTHFILHITFLFRELATCGWNGQCFAPLSGALWFLPSHVWFK